MFYHFYNKTGKKEVANAYFSSEVNSSRFFYDIIFMLVRHFCMNVRCVNIGKYKHFMSVVSGFICLDLAGLVGLKANLAHLVSLFTPDIFNALVLVPRMSVTCKGRLMDEDGQV